MFDFFSFFPHHVGVVQRPLCVGSAPAPAPLEARHRLVSKEGGDWRDGVDEHGDHERAADIFIPHLVEVPVVAVEQNVADQRNAFHELGDRGVDDDERHGGVEELRHENFLGNVSLQADEGRRSLEDADLLDDDLEQPVDQRHCADGDDDQNSLREVVSRRRLETRKLQSPRISFFDSF